MYLKGLKWLTEGCESNLSGPLSPFRRHIDDGRATVTLVLYPYTSRSMTLVHCSILWRVWKGSKSSLCHRWRNHVRSRKEMLNIKQRVLLNLRRTMWSRLGHHTDSRRLTWESFTPGIWDKWCHTLHVHISVRIYTFIHIYTCIRHIHV